jgi:hypothetical protein
VGYIYPIWPGNKLNIAMRLSVVFLFGVLFFLGCKEERSPVSSTGTLLSGVSLIDFASCDSTSLDPTFTLRNDADGIVVAIRDYFPCEADLEQPWLTLKKNGRATLVLDVRTHRFGFRSNCECFRSLKIGIIGRLVNGDTLYVVSGQEVLGHASIP